MDHLPSPTKSATRQALALALDMGYLIVIPLVMFGLGGRYLDKILDSSPWGLLSGLILSIASSSILLVRKFSKIIRDLNPPKSPS